MKKAHILVSAMLLLAACRGSYIKDKQSFSHQELREGQGLAAGQDMINPYKLRLKDEMGRRIAVAAVPLTRDNDQSTLGNFVCDALHHAATKAWGQSPDIVIVNRGGLRNNLAGGEVTVNSIFEVMPFDNELVLVTVSGKSLLAGIQTIVAKRHSFRGLNITLRGDSVVQVLAGGKAIDPEGSYTIATSDFVANGGDAFSFLAAPLARKVSGIMVRNAIITYCEDVYYNKKEIVPYTDERLTGTK